jgi:hypothetical protein
MKQDFEQKFTNNWNPVTNFSNWCRPMNKIWMTSKFANTNIWKEIIHEEVEEVQVFADI